MHEDRFHKRTIFLVAYLLFAILPILQNATPVEFFLRVTRLVVRLMEERTEDGYVFRTDLRLRPDPAATPLAPAPGAARSTIVTRATFAVHVDAHTRERHGRIRSGR